MEVIVKESAAAMRQVVLIKKTVDIFERQLPLGKIGEVKVGVAEVWELTDSLDAAIDAEEGIPVNTYEEAKQHAESLGLMWQRRWVWGGEEGDPLAEGGDAHFEYRQPRTMRSVWFRMHPATMILDTDQLTAEEVDTLTKKHGSVLLSGSHVPLDDKVDLKREEVGIAFRVPGTDHDVEQGFRRITHKPGLTKRREAARQGRLKKAEAALPSTTDLEGLHMALSGLGEHSDTIVWFKCSPKDNGRLNGNNLKRSITALCSLQKALGNPWLTWGAGSRWRDSILLRREAMKNSKDEFWINLVNYLESTEG